MRIRSRQISAALLFLLVINARAAVHYVSLNSPNPTPPFTNWITAATNIQDAVDAANPGDTVLVADGLYQAGARVSADGTTNRVVTASAILLQSLNGPTVTSIDGGQALRCVFLTNGAVLSGFTLTHGTAGNGGGVYCASTGALLSNCFVLNNLATSGGGVYSGTLTNCTLSGNTCPVTGGNGAGAAAAILKNCTLSGNVTGRTYPNTTGSTWGGGAAGCTLNDCTLTGNISYGAGAHGGGAISCTLSNCVISGGQADFLGGGAYNCTLTNCTISNNYAVGSGGGVSGGTLYNCVLTGNHAAGSGGAVYWTTTLINCTVVGNRANTGGGGFGCTLYNCIIYYNSGGDNYGDTFNYCCTPDTGGTGNITNAPLFVDRLGGDFHLQAGSPGIDAGTNDNVLDTDRDGNLRIVNGRVDMGAYEFHTADPLTVTIKANYTNVVVGYPVTFRGFYTGGRSNLWDFGDGSFAANLFSVAHAWGATGVYPVALTLYDDNYPAGVTGYFTVHVIPPPSVYVALGSTNPVPPYTSWATAATNIQDAVDVVDPGYHILVTNGVYQSGGRVVYGALTNRLVIHKPVLVQSVNGPGVTSIAGNPVPGDSAVRCVYMTNGATLSGFTLMNGATRAAGDPFREQSGGGIWCESLNAVITNCVVSSNSAQSVGGGVFRGAVVDSTLLGNVAAIEGGGAFSNSLNRCLLLSNGVVIVNGDNAGGGACGCSLSNCTLVGNYAQNGHWGDGAFAGGAYASTLDNCALTNNRADGDGGGVHTCTLRDCTLFGNSSDNWGGAGESSAFIGCLLVSNTAAVGAGADASTLTNCVLKQNFSQYQGGGASAGVLYNCLLTGNSGTTGGGVSMNVYSAGALVLNCTIVSNSASFRGGGIDSCTAWNSIVVGNSSPSAPDWYSSDPNALNYCCTTLLDGGQGNITNSPLFVNPGGGDFHLQTNSPCINSGNNGSVGGATDLDGKSRVAGGTVDIGAYEFQNPASVISYAWLQQYGLPTDGSADFIDTDHDRMSNWQEWVCGTDPTDPLSLLRMLVPSNTASGIAVGWQSVANRVYFLQRGTNRAGQPIFSTIRTNLTGQPGSTTFTDTNAAGPGPYFYRVGVRQ